MIDIHCHILPGVDDGAQSMADALAMAEQAVRSGVTQLCATPHSNQKGRYENFDSMKFLNLFYSLKNLLRLERIPLTLVRGMEIFADSEVLWKISSGQVIPLNESRYYLIEFGFEEADWFFQDTLAGVLKLGKVPVIAHPERYTCVQEDPNLLYNWRKLGALAQLNKGSVSGKFGPRAQQCAEVLLRHGLVNCVASDAHRPYARTTDMSEIEDYLTRNFPADYCNLLLEDNPGRILSDRRVSGPEPLPVEPQRWR